MISNRQRTKMVNIRFTTKEYEALCAYRKTVGASSISGLARSLVASGMDGRIDDLHRSQQELHAKIDKLQKSFDFLIARAASRQATAQSGTLMGAAASVREKKAG